MHSAAARPPTNRATPTDWTARAVPHATAAAAATTAPATLAGRALGAFAAFAALSAAGRERATAVAGLG
jgi:hypothetical protein